MAEKVMVPVWHNFLEALLSLISINCQTEMPSETHEIEKSTLFY